MKRLTAQKPKRINDKQIAVRSSAGIMIGIFWMISSQRALQTFLSLTIMQTHKINHFQEKCEHKSNLI